MFQFCLVRADRQNYGRAPRETKRLITLANPSVGSRWSGRENAVPAFAGRLYIRKERRMLGGYISDLEKGDEFEPVEYVLTAFMAREYAHGVEENWEGYHSNDVEGGRQMRTPTMIHADKMRILEKNCHREQRVGGMKGPDARIHYEYHATQHSAAYVGETLIVSGRITDRYLKRGRDYLDYYLEVRTRDGRLVTTYTDKTLLRFLPGEATRS
jgi:hypothetical protein